LKNPTNFLSLVELPSVFFEKRRSAPTACVRRFASSMLERGTPLIIPHNQPRAIITLSHASYLFLSVSVAAPRAQTNPNPKNSKRGALDGLWAVRPHPERPQRLQAQAPPRPGE
jgi:hypothetical protein